ncbi:MAG: bacterial Ig-like domain-containing protein [Clostridia bacterium]|nr:bacterial Ig-like domain-containing protein [Clostridia bacterium]
MKKFATYIMAFCLMFGFGVFLVGCDTPITITSISIKSGTLSTECYVNEQFSVEGAIIVVTYSDGTTEELTSEDINFDNIFDTLNTTTAGLKTLNFSYGNKIGSIKIKVLRCLESTDTVILFEAPSFVASYEYNILAKANKETEFYNKTAGYKVGDDNPFVFLPTIFAEDEGGNKFFPSAYTSIAIVEMFDEVTEEYTVLTDTNLTDMVEINTTKSSFDFTENAIGKAFKITVRPASLTAQDLAEIDSSPVSFAFTVVDGWNAYSAADLSKINNNLTTETDWATYKSENSVTSEEISSIILHNNILITANDIPTSYVWQENEVKGAIDYRISLGSLKDSLSIYTRMVASNDTFTLSGNYFTIDASDIPLIVRDDDGKDLGSTTYSDELISNSLLFGFTGDKAGTDVNIANGKCVMENLNVIGNSNRSELSKYLGGLTMVNSTSKDFIADNVISKCFLTNYTTQRAGVDGQEAKTTLNHCKTYDSFSCMMYLYGCETNDVTNSEFKRAGGPIALVCAVDDGTNHANINFADCVIENYVYGTEAWFSLNHAGALMAGIATMNQLVVGYSSNTKSIMNADGKLNFITAMIDGSDPLTFEHPLQGVTAINNGNTINDTILDMNAFNTNSNLPDLISAGAPILLSSAGGLGYVGPNGAMGGEFGLLDIYNNPDNNDGLYQGDYMYLFLKGGSQYIGACLEYFDIAS